MQENEFMNTGHSLGTTGSKTEAERRWTRNRKQ